MGRTTSLSSCASCPKCTQPTGDDLTFPAGVGMEMGIAAALEGKEKCKTAVLAPCIERGNYCSPTDAQSQMGACQ